MDYGVCILATIPGRAEPTDRSEMVTQLLFGESFALLHVQEKWTQVECVHDKYVCWIDNKQYLRTNAPTKGVRSLEMLSGIGELRVPFGALLPDYNTGSFAWKDERIAFAGQVSPLPISAIFDNNSKWLNTPYLWGGRSTFGVDCSGLMQIMFSIIGVVLPRDADQQALVGKAVDLVGLAMPGDLAFFDNEDGKIIHVGVVMDEQRILHSSGKVRIDRLDQEGIFNVDTGKYSHRLRLIKRVFD